jgi:hypothetical protein
MSAVPSALRNWAVPGAITALGLLLRLKYFNYFLVPDSDFFSLRATAAALMQGATPPSFQRLPLYSALFGSLAPLFRGRDPMLLAAETANLVAFTVSSLSLYYLSVRFLDTKAWIVSFLFAMDGLGFHMTAQPRTELPTVALVLLGCCLATRRPAAAYAAAGFAAITRYEGVFLIPALFARDFVFGPRRWRAFILAGGASTGLATWLWLNFRSTGHINPYFSYFGGTTSPAGTTFITVLIRACFDSVGLTAGGRRGIVLGVLLGALVVGGLVRMLRLSPAQAVPVVVFFMMTLALNLVFFSPTAEHAYLIVWVCELAAVTALVGLAQAVRTRLPVPTRSESSEFGVPLLLLAGVFLGFVALFWSAQHSGAGFPKAAAAASAVAMGAMLPGGRRQNIVTAALLAGVISVVPVAIRHNLVTVDNRLESARYIKGEMRRAGEWFAVHAHPNQSMAVTEPWVVGAYAGPISEQAFVATETLTSVRPSELADELRLRGVDYVLWDSAHGNLPPTSFYSRKYHVDLLRQLGEGHSSPDFELLDTLRAGPSYAYIYRVRR